MFMKRAKILTRFIQIWRLASLHLDRDLFLFSSLPSFHHHVFFDEFRFRLSRCEPSFQRRSLKSNHILQSASSKPFHHQLNPPASSRGARDDLQLRLSIFKRSNVIQYVKTSTLYHPQLSISLIPSTRISLKCPSGSKQTLLFKET